MLRLIDQRGPMGDMVSLAHDVTAALRYKTVMKTARKTAEANMRAKASFLANISHEIRTPLHGVVGMAGLLSSTTGGLVLVLLILVELLLYPADNVFNVLIILIF